MLFSQRKGLKPVKNLMQVDSMDDDLRNSLWNVLTIRYWDQMDYTGSLKVNSEMATLCDVLWMNYFKKTKDTLPKVWRGVHLIINEYFFTCKWNEVYDFIEAIIEISATLFDSTKFIEECNVVLKRELSAYRIIKTKIIQITSEEEIVAIEEALEKSTPLKPVHTHLKTALNLLSDKKSPNYRNSIKESISAVEAICRIIADQPKATLGRALKIISTKGVALHPALKKSFEHMYGYTSDGDGIRHSLLDKPNLKFIDAKFMLVSCSAFVNYLIEKASETGIKF